MKKILALVGTRPEVIKVFPVVEALQKRKGILCEVAFTGQHLDLVMPIAQELGLFFSHTLSGPKKEATLSMSASTIMQQVAELLEQTKPDVVLVQGDTTTAFSGALAAFYAKIPIVHVEAGLRTYDLHAPFPEEMHRVVIDQLASILFAPTSKARDNLLEKGVLDENIWVVGNSAIDAVRKVYKPPEKVYPQIVLTIHRRENQGVYLEKICAGVRKVAKAFPNYKILVFLHPNPEVNKPIRTSLQGISNITFSPPAEYSDFISHLSRSLFIVTDSGGIQEEAAFLGKPVLVLREKTEREEGVRALTAKIIGRDEQEIFSSCKELLEDQEKISGMAKVHYSYGDGYAGERMAKIIEEQVLEIENETPLFC
ncbi:MAG: UDP-N-acetylglucosamine 2-epimerase (non-hydrolyzing) [Candidatus Algichlamydia australiensis]|nr:UDP-N-acetylglucosamine 2-epimerase (non-hydrolyzing) [Chlamydiales bacterium]